MAVSAMGKCGEFLSFKFIILMNEYVLTVRFHAVITTKLESLRVQTVQPLSNPECIHSK